MTIPRRWQPPAVDKKTRWLDWWFRFATTGIASMFAYKTVNDKDTPDSEIDDIEMQEIAVNSADHDDCENASRPERSQQDMKSTSQNTVAPEDTNERCTHNNPGAYEYSSLKRTMGLRAPR
ncbi:unnamed protein product [Aureobasidium mustum]|uniref:Uncharacterized protein n=1 Tax=Aureobasidium mustum TaxID=2773714 RepID=A0A9N8K6C1_9PEZI|nr:unnamed protein product [Aureobasidium mustum]